MKANRGKNSHKWEQQHRKQPNKKKKISIRTKSSTEEGEGNYGDCDYFNKLSDDVITSLFLRCTLKSLSRLRCTSKLWNNFIISPSFLHSHLTQSTENDPKLLFWEKKRVHRRKLSRLRFVSVDMDGKKEELYTDTTPEEQFVVAEMQDVNRGAD